MIHQHGGVKLIHPEKLHFNPIRDMIQNRLSTLTVLSYKSRYGFMLQLTVPATISEYKSLTNVSFTSL